MHRDANSSPLPDEKNGSTRQGFGGPAQSTRGWELAVVAGVLSLVIWIAHFYHFAQFGLYEDDWDFIGQPVVWSWAKAVDWVLMCVHAWPQGRPVGFATVCMTAFIANRVGGVDAIYVAAFALQVLNAFLVFRIARRSLSTAPSLCAAIGFALLPSDTSTPLLTNALFLGLTNFFLLAALSLYLKGWRSVAYVVSACSLLTFESAFLPFFAAPLLLRRRKHRLPLELLKHWAILLGIGAFLFWFRARMGEEKAATVLGNGVVATLEKLGTSLCLGPYTTLRLSLTRLVTAMREGGSDALPIVAVLALALAAALYFLTVKTSNLLETWPVSLKTNRFHFQAALRVDQATAEALRFGGCGLVMLVMAYGLDISRDVYPPVSEVGRLTGAAHVAAATGYGFLCGAAAAILFDLGVSRRKKLLIAAMVACYFSALATFHYRVQRDFVASWHIQQAFWRSVLQECPDLADGTIILFEDFNHPLRYVETNSWADPFVLTELFNFPSTWQQPPRLYPVGPGWRNDIVSTDHTLTLSSPFGAWPNRRLIDGNVILLKAQGEGVRRVFGTTDVKSQVLELKPLGNPEPYRDRRSSLYEYVIVRK